MGIFFRNRPQPEQRKALSRSSFGAGSGDPIHDFLTGNEASGVTDMLRLAPVYAATQLIANQLAALPVKGYTDGAGGVKVPLADQPPLLTDPSVYGTQFDWMYRAMTSVLLRGNAVGLGSEHYRGWPRRVEWLDPGECWCDEDTEGKPIYWNGHRLSEAELVHVPGYVLPDQRWGLSPIGAYRSILQVGLAAQDYAAEWFTGSAIPKAILRNTEQTVVREVAGKAKEDYKKSMKHGDLFVVGKDWEWSAVSVPAEDAAFIATIKATATQIAAIFGVPPEMIGGETGSSLTYSTVEQNLLNFATLTLRPWVVRMEEVLTRLLPRGQYVKFNLDAVVRSDTKTKYDVMKIQADMKHRTQNELRALDDLPPVEGGDKFPEPPAPAPAPGGSEPVAAQRFAPDRLEEFVPLLTVGQEVRHPGHADQSVHGSWAKGSAGKATGSGTADDPIVTGDVETAARALGEGKHVRLTSKDEVGTLLNRLKADIDAAKASGEKKKINLCNVSVPGTNLFCVGNVGIARIDMPQVKAHAGEVIPGSLADQKMGPNGKVDLSAEFIDHLQAKGIGVASGTVDASHLKASQNELDADKVLGIAASYRDGSRDPGSDPIFVTRDNYVIDGHHRWAALVANEFIEGTTLNLPVRVVDVDVITALEEANAFATASGIPGQSAFQMRLWEAIAAADTRDVGDALIEWLSGA